MADANTELTLDALHSAIAGQLAAAFPSFKTVEFYRDDESESIPTPALLLEMSEAEPAPDHDAGTARWCAYVRFEARVILAARNSRAKLEVRKAATSLAAFLNLRHWTGISADACQLIACEPDAFTPKVDRVEVWRVEWVNLVMLGASTWHNDGTIPEQPFYAFSPNVGREPAYVPLIES